MGKTVFLFPGQGSQAVGMGKELAELDGICEKAGKILGFDLAALILNGPEEALAKTEVTQPAIMAVSLAAFEAEVKKGTEFSAVAGHSLGEYAAMVAAGMVSLEDGFRLIKARSEAMGRAARTAGGAMCAVIGPDAEVVEKICADADGYVIPVNYNSPVQTVIAGETAAVEAVMPKFAELKAKTVKLNVASAFHTKLMKPAADELYEFAKTVSFKQPEVEFFSNLTGALLTDFSDMPSKLAEHMVSPVRFVSEIQRLNGLGYTEYIELGPGKVLTGLVKKILKG